MQKYTEISENTPVEDSREQILDNDKTIASHYSGTAFPTENLVVGMECYRTDEDIKYRLTSLNPVTWKQAGELNGVPTAPTPDDTNAKRIANVEYVKTAIAALVGSSPAALDTLNELASALGNDPNFATTMTNALAGKAPLLHTHTKAQVGLANVDNTRDADKTVKTATNVSGGTVSATNITATNGRLESAGTSSNLPQVLLHIPNVNYSRLRMSTDGVIHAQNGGNDNYVNMKAANFIGNLSGNAATATKATQDSSGNVITGTYKRKNYNCTNFNNALTDGQYNVGGANITGAPYTGNIYGVLLVYLNDGGTHNNSSNWIWQQFYDTGGRYYSRYKVNGGGWTAWVLVSTNGNIRYADTAGNANKLIGKNWNWSGQNGQPAWLWGGSDGTNMYVYNPSNFRVANANTVGDLGVSGTLNNAANKIVRTDGNGYTQFGWVSTTSGAVGSINKIYCSNDNFIRYMTVANFKTALGINNVNNTADNAKNVASAAKLTTARKINGVAFDGTKDITINAGGISTSSNITVTASTQGALNFSGSISKGQVTGLKQATGLAAGTYTLQNLLQQIVNRTHTHSLATINCNCDCNCSDDGE